jgi:hypothetical protein
MGLSRVERIQPHWLDAIEALILVVNHNGPTMFARIGMIRALNHGKPSPELVPCRKRAKGLQGCTMRTIWGLRASPKAPIPLLRLLSDRWLIVT